MVLGELLLEFLSSLGSWAFADLFRKPALRLTLAVDPGKLAMTTESGDEIFRFRSQVHFIRNRHGTPQLHAVGDVPTEAPRNEVDQISLTDLLESNELPQSDATVLLGALLEVCDKKARDKLELPTDRKVRINICLPEDLQFANRLFVEASLQRARSAMKRQIPNFTSFRIQSH
jgi:hypothetical protein